MIAKIRKILKENLNIPPDKVQLGTIILDDLGLDSLDFVELIVALQDEFHVKIPDKEAMKLRTIKDVIALLESKGAKNVTDR